MKSSPLKILAALVIVLLLSSCNADKNEQDMSSTQSLTSESEVASDNFEQNAPDNLPQQEEKSTPKIPSQAPEVEPIDVETLPFFQEDASPTPTDPVVLEAQSATSTEDCEKYEGKLQEICYRDLGLSPNTSSYHEDK